MIEQNWRGRFIFADGSEKSEEWGTEYPECGDPIERAHPVTGDLATLARVEINNTERAMVFREGEV